MKMFSGVRLPISAGFLIFVTALLGMLAPFSIDTYLPSFKAIEFGLNTDRAVVTQTLAIYLVGFAVSTLFWGPWSDTWGRRPIILVSLGGYVVASLLAALAPNIEVLLLARFLQGVMVAGTLVTSRAMIRDFFRGKEAQKAMALMMMLFVLAPALAPIIGGWLEVTLGWRSVFYFLMLYGLVLFVTFGLRVPETRPEDNRQPLNVSYVAKSYWEAMTSPLFLRVVAAQGMLTGAFFLYIAGSASLIFDHLGLGEQDFWRFFVPMVSGIFLGSLVVHRVTSLLSARGLVNLAIFLTGVGVVANVLSSTFLSEPVPSAFWVIAPLVIFSFGYAMTNPGLTVAALDCFPTKRGLASSVQSLFQMGMAGVSTAIVVPLTQSSLLDMAYAQAGLWALGLVLWASVYSKVKEPI